MSASLLLPKDPYHIPGYCGYCPELKFQVSETYGNTTHRILKKINDHYHHGHDNTNNYNQVLQDNSFSKIQRMKPIVRTPTDPEIGVLEHRQDQFNSCYKYPVIPGYQGFVPRLRSSVGYRYTDSVKDAIKIYDRDDFQDKQEIERLRNFQKLRNSKFASK